MSIEMRVFFAGPVPTLDSIVGELRRVSSPLEIDDTTTDLESHTGFLPMRLGAIETGVETYCGLSNETIEDYEIENLVPNLDREFSTRWGSDMNECACALIISATFAKLTGGVIFDDSSGSVLTIDETMLEAQSALDEIAQQMKRRT